VIGRSTGWEELRLKALHGLNRRLSGIMVMTYDQLLSQGERLVELLGPDSIDGPQAAERAEAWPDFDDDSTF